MNHLPKGDLKTLDNLALYLQEIMSLPKEKKLIVDPKMKLIGTDIKRSLAELLQGPENFLRGEIDLPNMDDPKSIKSFLYRMQGGGRAGRDMLNKAPKGLDKLFNQHHVAGLMEMMPNYAGKSAKEARDISREIYELTGVMPGSHGGNLVEISADRSIHLGLAHGGSYKGIDISADTPAQRIINTKGAIRLNQDRAILAQDATKPLYNLGQELIVKGGGNKDTNYFLDNTLNAEESKLARAQFSKGMVEKFGKQLDPKDFLKESGIKFRAAGLGAAAGLASSEEALTKALDGDYAGALGSAIPEMALGEGLSFGIQQVAPQVAKIAPRVVGGAMKLGPFLAPVSAVTTGITVGNVLADNAAKRRKQNPDLTRNTQYTYNDAFMHSEDNPVTIQAN